MVDDATQVDDDASCFVAESVLEITDVDDSHYHNLRLLQWKVGEGHLPVLCSIPPIPD